MIRPAFIPILINYFQDRKISVKWNDHKSPVSDISGGGPQGATLGILEYLSQSDNCADMVSKDDRFRFVDDLSIFLYFIHYYLLYYAQEIVYHWSHGNFHFQFSNFLFRSCFS